MADNILTGRFQQAVYTAAALAAANPVLLDKEVVYESDSGRMKLGNGTTPWNNLPYFGDVQVGGVNLALNYNKKMQTDSYLIGTINLSTDLVEDDLLTISLDADIDDSQVIYIGLHPSSAELAMASKNSQGIYTVTFKFKKDVNNLDDVSNQLQLYNYPRTGNLVGCVNRIKLERGNKPTDWSPAPEDVDRKLAAAQQTAQAAQAAAAQKIGDAPQDGRDYIRKNGAWNVLNSAGTGGADKGFVLARGTTKNCILYSSAADPTKASDMMIWRTTTEPYFQGMQIASFYEPGLPIPTDLSAPKVDELIDYVMRNVNVGDGEPPTNPIGVGTVYADLITLAEVLKTSPGPQQDMGTRPITQTQTLITDVEPGQTVRFTTTLPFETTGVIGLQVDSTKFSQHANKIVLVCPANIYLYGVDLGGASALRSKSYRDSLSAPVEASDLFIYTITYLAEGVIVVSAEICD